MGSDGDGDDYESLATLVVVAIVTFAEQRDTHYYCYYSYLSRTRTAAVCDMPWLMHDIDGSEGEDHPPRVKRTRRVFGHPHRRSFICVCAEML